MKNPARAAAIALMALLGIAALPSGWMLMRPASGKGPLGMSVELLKGSPFKSYFFPGLVLFGIFGVGSLASAVAGWLRHWTAPYLAFALGVGLMIWIVVQYLIIKTFFFLQPVVFIWGTAIVTLSLLWQRTTRSRA